MIQRILPLLFLFILTGCMQTLPTSERLEEVRNNTSLTLAHQLVDKRFAFGAPPLIRVFKEEAELETWLYDEAIDRYRLFRTYPICKYSGTLGPKMAEGDLQSPEGFYTISAKQMNPWSKFHLSMNLGYPNAFERAHGLTGSALMIHGDCRSTGCYAMGDPAIEEIYLLVEASLMEHSAAVPVHVFPFRMTPNNMQRHAQSQWIPFWRNLQGGYDFFHENGIPPTVKVSTGHGGPKYVFQGARTKSSLFF